MNKDLEFIKKFSKITIANTCKKLNIDKSNVWSGKASNKNIKKVADEIKTELKKLI